MDVIVDNRIRIALTELSDDVAEQLRMAFEHSNPAFFKGKRIGVPTWGVPRKIVTWAEEDGCLTLPRGAMGRVRTILRDAVITWRTHDRRQRGCGATNIPDHNVELRSYQRLSVAALRKRENAILRSPAGSGKTTAVFGLIAMLKVPTLVAVPTGALLKDVWAKRARAELGFEPGIIRGKGKRQLRALTLTTLDTLARGLSPEEDRYFGCLVVDEVHRAAAKTFFAGVDPVSARYRIGVSDDEKRADGKEFLVYDLFGEVAYEVDRDEVVRIGAVLEVEVRVFPTSFRADWYREQREDRQDAIERERRPETTGGEDFNRLLREMAANEIRNREIVDHVVRELRGGEQAIVLAHGVEHVRKLDAAVSGEGFRTGLMLGGNDCSTEFSRTIEGLGTGDLRAGCGTYKALGTGIDLPAIGVGIGATPIASNKQFVRQATARICRAPKGKTTARFYYPLDVHVFGIDPIRKLLRARKNVVVLEHGEWVPAKDYLRRHKRAA